MGIHACRKHRAVYEIIMRLVLIRRGFFMGLEWRGWIMDQLTLILLLLILVALKELFDMLPPK